MIRHALTRSALALMVASLGLLACESETTKTGTVTEKTPVVTLSGAVAVEEGKTVTLSAATENGTDSAYAWTSSKDEVATVDESGTVTGVAEGEAVITATGADTGASGSWGVFVFKKGEDPVTPGKTPMVEISGGFGVMVGDTLTLTASTTDGEDTGYTWESGDDEIATVDESGVITGVKAGEALITATGKDTEATAKHGVVVSPQPEKAPDIPLADKWAGSGHADATAEAFRHWDEDGEVSASCAKCHSDGGYKDFLGADGSEAGTVDAAHATDTVIGCTTCHNAEAMELSSVTFPSGEVVEGLGSEARCMQCHQGRESKTSVDAKIAEAEVADDDTVDEDLGFRNIHYFAAGATVYGALAKGGYEYEGQPYDGPFGHVPGRQACLDCHSPHTLEVDVEGCAACHTGVTTKEDMHKIRMLGSIMDYDGDGSVDEGIYEEIAGLQEKLYAGIQGYAKEIAGKALVYDSHAYPYFFIDTDDDGEVDEDEANYGNRYDAWTARLVRATYNYQFSKKDPGAFVHNAKYVIELLHDSIADLNTALTTKVDMAAAHRKDAGHFAGSDEAFRHWDEDGEVSASCARCHSGGGLAFYLEVGANQAEPVASGFYCANCHVDDDGPELREAASVTFPSGATVDSGHAGTNLCMQCHQGRTSTASMNEALADLEPDAVSDSLRFQNIHYFAAGATRYGGEAMGGYQYEGKHYDGLFAHPAPFANCSDCHGTHTLELKLAACAGCHAEATDLEGAHAIRMAGSEHDYDGDGDLEEGVGEELMDLKTKLYETLQAYATAVGNPIVYDSHAYPYFFADKDGDGEVDPDEGNYGNRYQTWTPRLLKAAYNYQYAAKDPGAFAHNAKYVIELLYDSIEDLAMHEGVTVDMAAMVRNDKGHFDPTAEAFRHWDEDGAVPGRCARCHAPPAGLKVYLETGADPEEAQPLPYGMSCDTCHTGEDYGGEAPRHYVAKVTFPGGMEIMNDSEKPDDSFLCMTCHQGRTGKGTIDEAIAADNLRFLNVHYLAAGGSLYGSAAAVGYEYEGKTYAGKFNHAGNAAPSSCTYCHEVEGADHSFHVKVSDTCTGCHDEASAGDVHSIRKGRSDDYDGDGDNTEPLRDEIDGLAALLWAQIQQAAADAGKPILAGSGYPYFFNDLNDNGSLEPDEAERSNSYKSWTPALMRAVHNYQQSRKEHGAWAHNTRYTVQLLIDSIADLGGDVSGLTRP